MLSRYESTVSNAVAEEGPYAEIDDVVDQRTRKVSITMVTLL